MTGIIEICLFTEVELLTATVSWIRRMYKEATRKVIRERKSIKLIRVRKITGRILRKWRRWLLVRWVDTKKGRRMTGMTRNARKGG